AAYFASVPPIPIASSSGWAKTQSNRKGSVIPLCLFLNTLELKDKLFRDHRVINDQQVLIVALFGAPRKIVGTKGHDLSIDNKNFVMHQSVNAIQAHIQLCLAER